MSTKNNTKTHLDDPSVKETDKYLYIFHAPVKNKDHAGIFLFSGVGVAARFVFNDHLINFYHKHHRLPDWYNSGKNEDIEITELIIENNIQPLPELLEVEPADVIEDMIKKRLSARPTVGSNIIDLPNNSVGM